MQNHSKDDKGWPQSSGAPEEFRSGNSIEVERATIHRERMQEILYQALVAERNRLIGQFRKTLDELETAFQARH